MLQHSQMVKAYPFEYTHKTFDSMNQDQKQEVFENTKKTIVEQFRN